MSLINVNSNITARPVIKATSAPQNSNAVATDSVELGSPVATAVPNPVRPPADPQKRDWRDDIIYFAMTDRFQDGDPSNNFEVDKSNVHKFHGGDFQGLIDKADYIRNTGATAVWITPPMTNQQTFVNTDGYHGYWPTDLFGVDKHLGDMDKFKEMVDTFHDKGMKVIVDLPLNHVAWEHPFWTDPNKHEWFHHNGDVTDWDNQWQQENCSIFGLPDLAQENPQVTDYLVEVGKFWGRQGIDGFRLDAVRSVPASFWGKFTGEMRKEFGDDFLMIGEYYHGDPNVLRPFQDAAAMPSLVDYPMFYSIKEVFAKDGSMRALADKIKWTNEKYEQPEMMGIFPDNHDTQRFLTEAGGDKRKLGLALTFAMTMNRIPTIFYGTEQSFESDATGWSETSRKDMDFSKDPEMHAHFQKLTSIRNDVEPLRRGKVLEMWQDDQVLAYDRQSEKGEAIVALNNANDGQSRSIPLRAESKIANGTVMKDLMSGKTAVIRDGKLDVQLDAKSAGIYVPA